MKSRNLGALIGLVGAVNNNGKTAKTDAVVRTALLADDSDQIVDMVHEEKFVISPNCRTCAMPCGNTSDSEIDLNTGSDEVTDIKRRLLEEIRRLAKTDSDALPDVVYKAISYLGYDLRKESYEELLAEIAT